MPFGIPLLGHRGDGSYKLQPLAAKDVGCCVILEAAGYPVRSYNASEASALCSPRLCIVPKRAVNIMMKLSFRKTRQHHQKAWPFGRYTLPRF